MDRKELIEIFNFYGFDMSQYVGEKAISVGHINTTNVLYFDQGEKVKRYLLQRINDIVFKNPQKLMKNIENVCSFGKRILQSFGVDNYKNKILRIVPTTDNKTYVKTSFGHYFRVYHYIEGGVSYNNSTSPIVFENAGKAIGFFQNMLSSFPAEKLYEIIPHFHDTPYRYNTFMNSLKNADKKLVDSCKEEIQFYIDNKAVADSIQPLIDQKIMPLKVTHNDTKLNNIMFDSNSGKALCLVDLDTVMPGSVCYDFGDFIRSACNMGEEDDKDLSKVVFNKELFICFAKGYIASVISSITEIELKNLTAGAILMTYECGMRFLTDYLNGNTYFKVDYPEHNLIRSRTQIHLVKQMIYYKETLDSYILNIYQELIMN